MSDINVQTFQGKVNISNNLKVGSGHLFVDTLNNQVGLNTNTPLANLHVNGNTYVNTDLRVGSKLLIDSGASDSNVLVVTGGNIKADYLHGDGSNIQNITSSQWTTVNTNELYYDVGNVGIGNQNPSTTLDVTGTSSFSDDLTVGTDKLFVDVSAGRVGVGTVAPGYTLDIAGDINFTGNLTQNGSAYGGSGGSGGGVWQTGTGTKIYYSAGNVGIANTDPDHTLSVGSNLYVDDAGSNVLVVDGNVAANQITLGQFEIVPSYGLDDVVNESNTTTNTVHLSNVTTGVITTSNALIGGELTVTGNMVASSNITVTGNVVVDDDLYLTSNAKLLVDSNVVTKYTGPHGRDGAAVLKKYPEIVFEEGKFDRNDSTNTYTQVGYTVSVSGFVNSSNHPWKAFNGIDSEVGMLLSGLNYDTNGNANTSGTTASRLSASDSTPYGEWLKLELPNKIKLDRYIFTSRNDATYWTQSVEAGQVWGSNNDSKWVHLHTFTNSGFTGESQSASFNVQTDNYYKYYAFIVTKTFAAGSDYYLCIPELEYYGYEEDPPAGDTSIDTTFTSIMNTPQTTGAQVYVDGSLGETFTNRVAGPTPTGTAASYDQTGKYWELNGTLTSNIAVEANTFLSGDAPHSLSMWFNSSNLEANVSNTCVFSISDQEKLDSLNLDLQSNTWHNLTYAYQGEGGSRVTYLDGRKVAEDQAEDTFGEYPPFAMTGYSQGGYVVSASDEEPSYNAWKAFEDLNTNTDAWSTDFTENRYDVSTGEATINTPLFEGERGDWIQIQLPSKIKLNYIVIDPRRVAHNKTPEASPGDGRIFGSTDGTNWTLITSFSGRKYGGDASNENATAETILTSTNAYYSYYRLQVTKRAGQYGIDKYVAIGQLKIYGHRENDLVRLPDPTNVLKYPHIAMTGPAQRGYVASASSEYFNGVYPVWKAFNEDNSGYSTGWLSQNVTNLYNPTYNTGVASSRLHSSTPYGEYVILTLPHKLLMTKISILGRNTGTPEVPRSFKIYGSDTGTSWNEVLDVVDNTNINTSTFTTIDADTSTTAYNQFAIVITKTAGTTAYVGIGDWELYGTGVDSVPIQIGGGNIDKVANFRVYDKFIDQNQALEIWDAQKDEFGRAKSSMTLHKGRLGIGTTEPEGRLAVLDEPHNLEEFPPRAMTGYKNYFEGHGEFKASASHQYTTTGNGSTWKAFDKNKISEWQTSGGFYSSGVLTGTGLTTITKGIGAGVWLQIECPYKVSLKKFVYSQRVITNRTIKNGYVVGSNDTITWDIVHKLENIPIGEGFKDYHVPVSNYKFYKYFRLITTEVHGGDRTEFTEWRLFGTREQGQSVLHDGQLTLTKSLNVPRIGPALDADDTPRRDRLVVEYNTSTNPTFEGAVRDTSGRGNDGVMYGTAAYNSTSKDLYFDGNSDFIETDLGKEVFKNSSIHTTSLWVKMNHHDTDVQILFSLGNGEGNPTGNLKHINLYHSSNHGLRLSFTQHDYRLGDVAPVGNWVHVVYTYDGTTWQNSTTPTNVNIYINGVKVGITSVYQIGGGPYTTNSILDLSVAQLALGAGSTNITGISRNYTDADLSNFKLYDVALTAEEVKTLYDMGRTGHIVNPQPLHIAAPLYSPGTIVQVESSTKTDVTTIGSTTAENIAGLSVTINPKFSTSKVLVSYYLNVGGQGHGFVRIKRTQGGTTSYIGLGDVSGDLVATTSYFYRDSTLTQRKGMETYSFEFLDSANGTSAITYDIMCWKRASVYAMHINKADNEDTASYYGRTSSSITVKEVCQ